ncbi:hypothetical protein FIU87_03960 [Bacillus sp. THAF10]|nr:hypothetical protein FIU87_03960 [Bacillus sp. THAF10]
MKRKMAVQKISGQLFCGSIATTKAAITKWLSRNRSNPDNQTRNHQPLSQLEYKNAHYNRIMSAKEKTAS